MRTLNLKLFLILTGSLILGSAGLFLVHSLQAGRIAQALLWQADRAEKDNDPPKVVKYLKRYLEFKPHDLDARAQLGRTLAGEKVAVSDRAREAALFVLEPVIARQPERNDLRRLVVRLALAFTPPRLETAREHLDALHDAFPEDGEIAYLQGQYYEAVKDDPQAKKKAEAAYRQAIQQAPERLDGYVRLAALLRGPLNQPPKANQVMDDLVRANGQSSQAYLLRARYRLQDDLKTEAAGDVERARALAPDDPEVILAAAEVARARDQLADARRYLNDGLKRHRRDARLYHALAQVEVTAQQRGQAIAWLQAGVKATSGPAQCELLWHLANLLIDEGRTREAEADQVVAQLSKVASSSAVVPYLQARILVGREDWAQAASLLERARQVLEPSADATRELLVQIDLYLGLCYEQLHEPARQLDAFERVVKRDPQSEPGRLGMATALRGLGKLDAARRQYEELSRLPRNAATYCVELARLRTEQTLLSGGSDWNEIEDLIRQAEKADAKAVEVVMVRAQFLTAQNKLTAAREFLEKAYKDRPRQVEFWSALAELAEREKQWSKAQAILDQVEHDQGDSVVLRLARARFWVNQGAPEARAAVAKLGEGRQTFPVPEQARLLQGLAEAFYRLGDLKQAAANWTQLTQLPGHQKDLRLRMVLFDLAMQEGHDDKMRETIREMESLEGAQGTLARYGEALRLIWKAKQAKQLEELDRARALLDQVAAQRPAWPAVFLAKGEIDNLKGDLSQAITNYRQAIKLGETGPRAVRPLVQALYRCQRYDEANQEIGRLQKHALTADLRQLSAEISIRQYHHEQAADLALQAVDKDSTNYQDLLWLGQILAASGQKPKEAEQHLRRALELGADHAETWVALVKFLVNANRRADAEAVILQAAKANKLPPNQAPLALAQCHELMGRGEQARQYFQAALAGNPQDAQTLRSVAGFDMRAGRLQEAEPLLRKLKDGQVKVTDNDVNWARRGLAMVLVTSHRFDQFTQALDLVGLKLDAQGRVVEARPLPRDEMVEEQRARARVLATRTVRAIRAKAIALFEDLSRQGALTIEDQFLLVQLYEATQEWAKAEELLRPFLRLPGEKALYVVHYVQVLLNLQKWDEANAYIRQLQEWETHRQAKAGSLATADLQILKLKLQGHHDQAIQMLRDHVKRDGARPEEVLSLISYLGKQNRVDEALTECANCWQKLSPEIVGGASVAMLRSARPTAEQCAKVESWLQKALQQPGASTVLYLHLADLYDFRGRYQDAADLYRKVLAREPGNVVALNNLAWLLALKDGKADEAQKLIHEAIDILGPQPDLLDTRAVVFLALKQPEAANADLEKAMVLDAPTGARYFHRARAYQMANKRDAAAKAFREARKLGLQREHLHPVEAIACGKDFDELDRR
jgi:tetratricopeptide (TPR) repeat protein